MSGCWHTGLHWHVCTGSELTDLTVCDARGDKTSQEMTSVPASLADQTSDPADTVQKPLHVQSADAQSGCSSHMVSRLTPMIIETAPVMMAVSCPGASFLDPTSKNRSAGQHSLLHCCGQAEGATCSTVILSVTCNLLLRTGLRGVGLLLWFSSAKVLALHTLGAQWHQCDSSPAHRQSTLGPSPTCRVPVGSSAR